MPVAELNTRVSGQEFVEWMALWAIRADEAKQRKASRR
jgi:hypothetical protein